MLIFFKLVCISWLKSASPFASPYTIIVAHSFSHSCNHDAVAVSITVVAAGAITVVVAGAITGAITVAKKTLRSVHE